MCVVVVGMLIFLRRVMVWVCVLFVDRGRWVWMVWISCWLIVMSGFRLVNGFWNIIVIFLFWIWCNCFFGRLLICLLWSWILLLLIWFGWLIKLIMVELYIDLFVLFFLMRLRILLV